MITKKELLKKTKRLESDQDNIRYATKEIAGLLGRTIRYYAFAPPSLSRDSVIGSIPERIQAICDYLGIEIQYSKIKIVKKQTEIVAVAKKNK